MQQSVVTWHMQCVYGGDGFYHMLLYISISTFAAADFNLNPNCLRHHKGSVLQIII